MNYPTGYIAPKDRTALQWDAHEKAEARMVRHHALPIPKLARGQAVRLFDAWRHPKVVAEVGLTFDRFRQFTGSCVGVGAGNALFSLICAQRLLADNPTKAFIPFWPFSYGRSRFLIGDTTPGDGSFGSAMAETLVKEGVLSADDPDVDKFTHKDGLTIPEKREYFWSDGDEAHVTSQLPDARPHPVGAATPCKTADDIQAAILNGYPVTFACNNNIADASIVGSGADACIVGRWNRFGPHQQSVHAFWEHPNLGPLFWAQNSWVGNVYQSDPAGGPTCGCWVKRADVTAALKLDAEVYALSHLTWFPAQPDVPEVFDFGDYI